MKEAILMAVAMLVLLSLTAAPTRADKPVVYARDFFNPDSPTCGIQEAIDSLPKEGGQVVLEPITYVLRAPIVLRDDLRISGQRPETVLTRGREVIHKLTADAPAQATTVTVDSTAGLRLGDEIGLRDDDRTGWYMTHARIVKIEGNTLTLDTGLVRDYAVARNAIVINHHPIIEAYRIWDYRYHTRRFVIEDLTIEGNLDENPTPISDWSTAAIHLASTADGIVQRCIVRNWITDGISDQYGINNLIRECVVENCRGNGFHPGTSVRGSQFLNNLARGNLGDGFFFCADVTALRVIGNEFSQNRGNGIGDLGNGGDSFNVVSNNVCRENGRNGIQATKGGRNIITNNICLNNSLSEPGAYAGIALENVTDTVVMGNICGTKVKEKEEPAQGYGIVERGESDRNIIRGNIVGGNARAGVQTVGAATVAIENLD